MTMLPLPFTNRPLGTSSITISPMAWGMWRLADDDRTVAEASALVHAALDAGITLLDTADIYGFDGARGFGDAEMLLGAVLRAEPDLRARMVLATKGGILPPVPYNQSAHYLAGAIDNSLRRLGVEVIDLYQVHRPDILTHPHEVARALDDAIAAGKIRTIGVSNFTIHQTAALAQFLGHPPVSTQPEISALRITCFENGELDQAMMLGLVPLAWSPLGGGRVAQPVTAQERTVAAALDVVASAYGISRTVAAYSWLMAHPAGIVPIVGSQNAGHIAEAATATRIVWSRREWYAVFVAARGEKLP